MSRSSSYNYLTDDTSNIISNISNITSNITSNASCSKSNDLTSKVNLLDVYYNLLSEKVNYLMSNSNELEEKFKNFKHKIYILTHKMCVINESINNLKPKYRIIEKSESTSINGGSTNKDIWTTLTFNNIQNDSINDPNNSNVTLNNNIITISKGNFVIDISSTFFRTGQTKIRLYNMTDDIIINESLSHFVNPSYQSSNQILNLSSLLHLTKTTDFIVQYITQYTVNSYGLGLSTGFSDKEIYSKIKIIKNL